MNVTREKDLYNIVLIYLASKDICGIVHAVIRA